MSSTIRQANIEIERAKAISERNSRAVKELENKWIPLEKSLKEKQLKLRSLLEYNSVLREYSELVALSNELAGLVEGSGIVFEPILVLDSKIEVGSGTHWSRAVSRINELELAYSAIALQLVESGKEGGSGSLNNAASQATVKLLSEDNQRLAQ